MKTKFKKICIGAVLFSIIVASHASNSVAQSGAASLASKHGEAPSRYYAQLFRQYPPLTIAEVQAADEEAGFTGTTKWVANSAVPLTAILIAFGSIIILAELYHRQNKLLREILCSAIKTDTRALSDSVAENIE